MASHLKASLEAVGWNVQIDARIVQACGFCRMYRAQHDAYLYELDLGPPLA